MCSIFLIIIAWFCPIPLALQIVTTVILASYVILKLCYLIGREMDGD